MLAKRPAAKQGQSNQASAEQNEQLKRLTEVAIAMIHDEQTGDAVQKLVVENKDPIAGLANGTVMILRRIEERVKQIDDAVRVELARQVLNELSKLAIRTGMLTKEQFTPDFLKALIGKVVEIYLSNRAQSKQIEPRQLTGMVQAGKKFMDDNPDKFSDIHALMGTNR